MNEFKLLKNLIIVFAMFSVMYSMQGQSVAISYKKECSGYELKIKQISSDLSAFWEYIDGVLVTEGYFRGTTEDVKSEIYGKTSEPNIYKIKSKITGKLTIRNEDGTLKSKYQFIGKSDDSTIRKMWVYKDNELVEYTSSHLTESNNKTEEDAYGVTDSWIQYLYNKPIIITSRNGPIVHTVYLKNEIQYAENFDINYLDIRINRPINYYENFESMKFSEEVKKQVKQLQKRKNYTNVYYDIHGNITYRYTKYKDTLQEEWLNSEGKVYKRVKGIIDGFIVGICEGCEDNHTYHSMGTLLIKLEQYDKELKQLLYSKTITHENKNVEKQEIYKRIDGIEYTCKARFYIMDDRENYPEDSILAGNFYCSVLKEGMFMNCGKEGYNVVFDNNNSERSRVYSYCYGNSEQIINSYHSCTRNIFPIIRTYDSYRSIDTIKFKSNKRFNFNRTDLIENHLPNLVISKDFESCFYGFKNQSGSWIMKAKYDKITLIKGINNGDKMPTSMYYQAFQYGIGKDLINEDLKIIFHSKDDFRIELFINDISEKTEQNIFFFLTFKDSVLIINKFGRILYRTTLIKRYTLKIFENMPFLSVYDATDQEGKIINLFTREKFVFKGKDFKYYNSFYFSSDNILYFVHEDCIQPITEFNKLNYENYKLFVEKADTLIIITVDYKAGYFILEKIPMDNPLDWVMNCDRIKDPDFSANYASQSHIYLKNQRFVKYRHHGKWGVMIANSSIVVQPPVWDDITEDGIAKSNGNRYFFTTNFSDTINIHNNEVIYYKHRDYYNNYEFYTISNETGLIDIYSEERTKINSKGALFCGLINNNHLFEPVYWEGDSIKFIKSNGYWSNMTSGVFRNLTDQKYYIVYKNKIIKKAYNNLTHSIDFQIINPEINTWSFYYTSTGNSTEYNINRLGNTISENPIGMYNAELFGHKFGMDDKQRIYEYNCNSIYYFPDSFSSIFVSSNPDLFLCKTNKNNCENCKDEAMSSFLFSKPLNSVYPHSAIRINELKNYYLLENLEHFKHLADLKLNCIIKPDSWRSIQILGEYFICEKLAGIFAFDKKGNRKKLKGEGTAIVSDGYLCVFKQNQVTLYDSTLKLLGNGSNYLIPQIKRLDFKEIPFYHRSNLQVKYGNNEDIYRKNLNNLQISVLSEKQKIVYKILQFRQQHPQYGNYASLEEFPKGLKYKNKPNAGSKINSEPSKKVLIETKTTVKMKPTLLPTNQLKTSSKPLFNELEYYLNNSHHSIKFCKGEVIAVELDNNSNFTKGNFKHFVIEDSGIFLFDLYDMVDVSHRDTFVSLLQKKIRDIIISQGQTCSSEMTKFDFDYLNKIFSIDYDTLMIEVQDRNWRETRLIGIPLQSITSMLNKPFRNFFQ